MNTEIINNQTIVIKETNNRRLISFKDIDEVHNKSKGTARKRFNTNKKHFIKGEDYIVLSRDEAKTQFDIIAPNNLYLMYESGYLLLAKTFEDDLAWQVQRQLVNTYFKAKEILGPQNTNTTATAITQQNQLIMQMISNQQESQRVQQEQNQVILQTISIQQMQAQAQTQQQLTTITNLITSHTEPQYEPQFTYWLGKTYKKRDTLAEYNGITKTEMLHSLYNELQDTYDDIDLNECRYEYCFQHGIPDNKLYTMNAIGADTKLKRLFDLMIDTRLEQMDNKQNAS